MLARRLTPVLALVAVAGLAASGCASQAVGVRVGDTTVSQADMMDELDAWASNEVLVPPGQEAAAGVQGDAVDSYSQDFVGSIVQQRIQFIVAEQLMDENGLELTDADRDAAERELPNQLQSLDAADAFPADYREHLIDDLARLIVLTEELGREGLNEAIFDTVTTSDIEVNPRFGDWDEDELGIVPPDGPTPGPDADSGAGMPSPSGPAPGAAPAG